MKRETDSKLVPSAEAARHGSSLRTGAFLARRRHTVHAQATNRGLSSLPRGKPSP